MVNIKSNNLHTVNGFYDKQTSTISYVVSDNSSKKCAVIDSVLDFDYSSGSIEYKNADEIISFIKEKDWEVEWLIETHVHADHLSASPYIQKQLGGKIGISEKISEIHTPGHTPACTAHVIEDSIFVGDTMFMPDLGSARADFPGGDARLLYKSIQKILTYPDETKLFVCHDYPPETRNVMWSTTVGEQKIRNIHINKTINEDEFVKIREDRDKTLNMPQLIIPSIQVNMRAGNLPPPEDNGSVYIKVPINNIKNLI